MNPAGQQASPQKRRRSARARVFLAATLEYLDSALPVVLRDLSEHGALIEGNGIVADDREILLRRKGLRVSGRVAWARGNRAGIAFTRTLSPEVVMEHVARRAPRPAADVVHRRPGVTQRLMSLEERRWFEQLNRGRR